MDEDRRGAEECSRCGESVPEVVGRDPDFGLVADPELLGQEEGPEERRVAAFLKLKD